MITEIYRPIENYYKYEISNLWNIRKLRTDWYFYLAKRKSSNWYIMSTLINRQWQRTYKIHRLVAIAFIENPENKRTVNHKNWIKTDNQVDNLEWATHWENMKHSYDNWLRNI